MASKLRLMINIVTIVGLMHARTHVFAQLQVPCYFIFGDSLVDSGNNNALTTAAKANYPPYGIDFAQGVSGRFTNGRTIADIIGQLLGFVNYIPPYTTATDQQISTGVNYGSGSAGIREESGSHLGDRVSLDRQLVNHEAVLSRLSVVQQNKTSTNEYVKKCMYISDIGSNDYINNYLIPDKYNTSSIYTTDQYAVELIQQYSQQLKTLYNLGARKVAVFGIGLVGCTPAEIARFGTNGQSSCVDSINDAVKLFNDRLKPLVNMLNNNFSDAKFTFVNMTSIDAPEIPGATLPNVPCCQTRGDGQCVANSTPCSIRASSVFYDGFHPTEAINIAFAARAYTERSIRDASPYDISQLAQFPS